MATFSRRNRISRGRLRRALGTMVGMPVVSSVNILSLVLTLWAMLAVFRFKIGMIPAIAGCSGLGLLHGLVSGTV